MADAEALAARLRVGLSIITFNAERLHGHCRRWLTFHEYFSRSVSD